MASATLMLLFLAFGSLAAAGQGRADERRSRSAPRSAWWCGSSRTGTWPTSLGLHPDRVHRAEQPDPHAGGPVRAGDRLRGVPALPGARGVGPHRRQHRRRWRPGCSTPAASSPRRRCCSSIVVAGFATGGIAFIKLIGVGMIVAIVVDATLVRAAAGARRRCGCWAGGTGGRRAARPRLPPLTACARPTPSPRRPRRGSSPTRPPPAASRRRALPRPRAEPGRAASGRGQGGLPASRVRSGRRGPRRAAARAASGGAHASRVRWGRGRRARRAAHGPRVRSGPRAAPGAASGRGTRAVRPRRASGGRARRGRARAPSRASGRGRVPRQAARVRRARAARREPRVRSGAAAAACGWQP